MPKLVTKNEIMKFIGLTLYMGINVLPNLKIYC